MEKINCVIIDDEPHSIGVMKMQLESHCPEVEVLATFTDSILAFSYLQNNQPSIVFVDIEMPRLNGFELLTKLGEYTFKPIITSAYDEFGIKAIKHQIFDYLVKPIDPDELVETIKKYTASENSHSEILTIRKDKILLPDSQEVKFVSIENIIRCESDKNYTTVFLSDGSKTIVSKTIKVFEELLPESIFLRVHNKHLVNSTFIKSYIKTDGGSFQLEDGSTIPLSRYRKDEIFKILGLR